MHLPRALVSESFLPPGPALDFDAVGAPRRLRPRPVVADADAGRALRADLAWFWNSNADWADSQVAVAEDYGETAARLVGTLDLRPDDRVVLSLSEPDGRRDAWIAALPEGTELAFWPPRGDGLLHPEDLEAALDERTRLVLMTKACPLTGAVNEVVPVAQRLAPRGIALFLEASHFAAHGPLDLRNLRCDAVAVDGAELFGASGAAAWVRRPGPEAAEEVAAGELPPGVVAGWSRAVRYVERLGEAPGALPAPPSDRFGRREAMRRGMQGVRQEERVLSRTLLRGLARVSGISVLGEADPWRAALRTPAVSFVPANGTGGGGAALAEALRQAGAEVGGGDLGCRGAFAVLDEEMEAGAVRVSLAHYHTAEEIERFLGVLRGLL